MVVAAEGIPVPGEVVVEGILVPGEVPAADSPDFPAREREDRRRRLLFREFLCWGFDFPGWRSHGG